MKKIFMLKILAILLLTNSCNADTFHYYKYDVHELLKDPKARKLTENQIFHLPFKLNEILKAVDFSDQSQYIETQHFLIFYDLRNYVRRS